MKPKADPANLFIQLLTPLLPEATVTTWSTPEDSTGSLIVLDGIIPYRTTQITNVSRWELVFNVIDADDEVAKALARKFHALMVGFFKKHAKIPGYGAVGYMEWLEPAPISVGDGDFQYTSTYYVTLQDH